MKIPQVMDSVYVLYRGAKGSEKRMKMLNQLKKKIFENRASNQHYSHIDNIIK